MVSGRSFPLKTDQFNRPSAAHQVACPEVQSLKILSGTMAWVQSAEGYIRLARSYMLHDKGPRNIGWTYRCLDLQSVLLVLSNPKKWTMAGHDAVTLGRAWHAY